MRTRTAAPNRETGFSYVEVLVATVLIVSTLVPAMDALHSGVNASGVYQQRVSDHYYLTSLLEEVLAEPFDTLDAAAGTPTTVSSYSDAGSSSNRRIVYLSRYDGDNADADDDPFTGTDADLLWLRVEYENGNDRIDTLIAR